MSSSICMTPACIHAASQILYNLSPDYKTIDPCTDFDTLVCTGFNDRNDIPADSSQYSTLSEVSDDGQKILRHILESSYPEQSKHSSFSPRNLAKRDVSTDEESFLTLQKSYNACMNETNIEKIGVAPLVNFISQVADSFPVSEEEYGNDATLAEGDYAALSDTILLMEKLGITTFASLGTSADEKNPDVVIPYVSPAGLTLSVPESYQDNETVALLQGVLEKSFGSLLPTEPAKAAASKLSKAVIDLEKKIAEVTPPAEQQNDITIYYNIATIDDAGKVGPALGLDKVFKGLFPEGYNNDTLQLTFPEFIGNVSEILTNTPKSAIQSYLIAKVIFQYASYVEGPEVESVNSFGKILSGIDPDTTTERWKTCIDAASSTVGWILSRFYVEAAFSEKAKQYGDDIIVDIKEQFISKLKGLDWMDDGVKKLAENKVNNIIQKIGYPTASPNIMDPQVLQDYYKDLVITDSYFDNAAAAIAWGANRTWSSLSKPVDRDAWGMYAPEVNAYYNPSGNEIVFPAGIMQFPIFSVDLPSYVSYGSFGAIAGHELSHAFDNSGSHFDENGKYADWWTNSTLEEFEKRTECFVKQYDNFTIDGKDGEPLHVNGGLTLGENIADAGGLSAAFGAWQQNRNATFDTSLPGLDYFTHEQLFYVFFGNLWCGKIRQEALINQVQGDVHSPGKYRVLGTLANSRGFRDSFNCPVKEPTCELW
ncbi:peptidase family M13 [Biscogniauxia sp. FL1348]|nr:peptidase family M13 [Biscogniauxia sp. FL1348]